MRDRTRWLRRGYGGGARSRALHARRARRCASGGRGSGGDRGGRGPRGARHGRRRRRRDPRQRAEAPAPDPGRGRRQEHRLPVLPQRHRADARVGAGEPRLRRLPRRQRRRSTPASAKPGSTEYAAAQRDAHVAPRHPEGLARPDEPRPPELGQSRAQLHALNDESPEFIRFINPGDLRVAAGDLRQLPRERGRAGASGA